MWRPRKTETGPERTESADRAGQLAEFVRQHRVCWEVLPEQYPMEGEKPFQVGFDLKLYGAHAHATDRPLPGCEECKLIFTHLREIAEWIVPKAERASRYEIDLFDNAVRYDPVRRNRPEVTLTIRILHRGDYQASVDECEALCLHEMEDKLKQLGAQNRVWKEA